MNVEIKPTEAGVKKGRSAFAPNAVQGCSGVGYDEFKKYPARQDIQRAKAGGRAIAACACLTQCCSAPVSSVQSNGISASNRYP